MLLSSELSGLTNKMNEARFIEDTYSVEETYMEKVIIKPGGLFRSAITEMQPRTRTVIKTRKVMKAPETKIGIYDGSGNMISSILFCFIPAGTFVMGDAGKLNITISRDFFMAKYPITQTQWEAVMKYNPSSFKGSDLPVENVSWEDCQDFMEKLNQAACAATFRLPTESEWEYACRAGSNTKYYYGDTIELLSEYAWYDSNSVSSSTNRNESKVVGQKKPNSWGLHDMHGNVFEWCQDWYAEDFINTLLDPQGPTNGTERIKRGGAWNSAPQSLIVSYRAHLKPTLKSSFIGFRIVKVI